MPYYTNERQAPLVSNADDRKGLHSESAEILEKTIHENYSAFHRKSTAMLRNSIDAEDAVQNAFMKAWRYQSNLRDTASAYSWLNRILYNECLAISKNRSKHASIMSDQQLDQLATINTGTDNDFEHWFIETILSSLPDHYRHLLILFYEKGFTANEIAEVLNLEPKLVRHQIAYARKLVKEKYLELADEE